jgi:hypothetical protein
MDHGEDWFDQSRVLWPDSDGQVQDGRVWEVNTRVDACSEWREVARKSSAHMYNQGVVLRASTIGMMEAPIRLFEHFKTGRRLPRITVYALTLQTFQYRMTTLIRINAAVFASPGVNFVCPGQGVSA